jgi:hypothetical protein
MDSSKPNAAQLAFIHRSDGDAQLYFVSNQRARYETVECSFRQDGKAPEQRFGPNRGKPMQIGPNTNGVLIQASLYGRRITSDMALTIFSVGHSNTSLEDFLSCLVPHAIGVVQRFAT